MMTQEAIVPLKIEKMLQTHAYCVVIMNGEGKRFALYVDPTIGNAMQMYLTGTAKPRPLTHDLLSSVFQGLEVKPTRVVINDLQGTVYFARLFLEQQQEGIRNILEIDARPSDCMALALLNNIPIYCTKAVLEKTLEVHD